MSKDKAAEVVGLEDLLVCEGCDGNEQQVGPIQGKFCEYCWNKYNEYAEENYEH